MKKRAIGLEFDDEAIYLVQLFKEKGHVHLESWQVVQLPSGLIVAGEIKEEEALLERVSSLFGKKNNPSLPIVIGISGAQAFIRKIQLPLIPSKEMDQLIRWEGENILPCPIAEVYYNYQILHNYHTGYQILFVAVSKERVQPYQSIFQQLKLPANFLTLQSFGLVNYLEVLAMKKDYTGILVRFRSKTIDFILLYHGEVELIRTVLFPDQTHHFSEKLAFFQNEFFVMLGYFQSIYDIWINTGFFFGSREWMQKIRSLLPTFHWRHLYLADRENEQSGEFVDRTLANQLPATWGLGVLGVSK